MSLTIALIHTSPSMIPVFKPLAAELLPPPPAVNLFNMVDESLLCDIIRDGCTPAATARRLAGHVLSAEAAGAEFIMVTCSSMGRAVEAAQALCAARVLRVDEPMAKQAARIGRKIGVVATLPSTLEPTVALLRTFTDATVVSRLVDGAFAAVISGNGQQHDALVAAALKDLGREVDVIVLAQASMARVVDTLSPADKPVPILSSPRLAMEHLARLIAGEGDRAAQPQ